MVVKGEKRMENRINLQENKDNLQKYSTTEYLLQKINASGINVHLSKEEMKAILQEMVNKMDTGENFVYWQVTRGSGPRNHVFPTDGSKGNLWINIFHKNIVDIYKKIKVWK